MKGPLRLVQLAGEFLSELLDAIQRNRALDVAAELAYWSLFSVFPFGIFVLTVVGFVPLRGLDTQLLSVANQVMPRDAFRLLDRTVHEVVGRQRGILLLVALVGAVWSASGAVGGTIKALNRAWRVEETRPYWHRKLLALAMTAAAGVLSVVATVAMIIGPEIMHHVAAWFGLGREFNHVWRMVRWPLVVTAMMLMLAAFYRFLPNVQQRFHLLSVGAVVTVLAWIGASVVFNQYVAHFHSYAKTYGTLGAAMMLLSWLYISGLLVIVGGEINALWDRMARARAEPS
jgi:membrane protein